MKLPNRERAYVPPEKIQLYLLSQSHPIGRAKAQYLRNLRTCGFDERNAAAFERVLLDIAQSMDVIETEVSQYGSKYVLDGSVATPTGGMMALRTVWIIETGQAEPRFVTAYPKENK